MGNKPGKQAQKKDDKGGFLVKVAPPVDRTYIRWLAKDLARVHGFTPKNPCAVTPPDQYIEYMRLKGWLDLDLDDPDLTHLFK